MASSIVLPTDSSLACPVLLWRGLNRRAYDSGMLSMAAAGATL